MVVSAEQRQLEEAAREQAAEPPNEVPQLKVVVEHAEQQQREHGCRQRQRQRECQRAPGDERQLGVVPPGDEQGRPLRKPRYPAPAPERGEQG